MARLTRLPIVWIAGLALVAIAVSGAGLYAYMHRQPVQVARTSFKSPPPLPSVGTTTVTKSVTVEVLTVVSTTPAAGSSGAPLTTPIAMHFNLPVDATAAPNYFSVLPNVAGGFAEGTTPEDIVFTPSSALGSGAAINVVLRKGFPSRDGVVLQNDFAFSFNTAVSSRDVAFTAGNQLARLYGAASRQSVSVQPQFGNQVPSDLTVQIFKATSAGALAAQVHDANGTYSDRPIDTSSMQQLDQKPIANNTAFHVAEPDGVYLLLAVDPAGQYGAMWIDFSHYGVVLRQDDQRIVVGGEDLTTGDTTPSFNITFYNLAGAVQKVTSGSFSGTGEFKVAYGTSIDIAVATSGAEDVLIPLGAPQTAADIKVVGDLSTTSQIFLTTDRSGYQSGDTVKFAGIVRTSNDQAYSIPAGMTMTVWSQANPTGTVVPVAPDGTFSGSFPMPSSAFNADGSDGQTTVFAGSAVQHSNNYSPFSTVVAALGPHSPAARLAVSFDKTSYVSSDTIQASIAGTDNSGKPLAGKPLSLTVYATAHLTRPSELDSFTSPSSWGVPVVQNVSVTLDGAGHASYAIKANVPGQAADQEVTLAATYGAGSTAAVGARTAVVFQATSDVYLLPTRTAYLSGDTVVAPFVVETTAGQRVASAPMSFEIDKTDYQGSTATTTVVGTGSVVTDASGVGVVRTVYSGPAQSLILRVKGKDGAGNVFVAALPIAVLSDPSNLTSFGQSDALTQLSVIADKIAYSAGDVAHLTVNAPAAEPVFLSAERGRIHTYRWVSLVAGDNPLSLNVTPDLAPGFTLTFSYFRNGLYYTEGIAITVSNSARMLKLTAKPDLNGYTSGQTAHVTVTVTDSTGAPVVTTLIVDGYDAYMSANKLVDTSSIAGAFLKPAARGTNGSSSLLGIGSWGGRCGGGFNGPQPAVTNPGRTAVWVPDVTTDANGTATIDVPVASGAVRLVVMGSTSSTLVGQTLVELNVQ